MIKKFLYLLVTVVSFSAFGNAAGAAHTLVSPSIMQRVLRVHDCEEPGNWNVDGPRYYGGLGWLSATWLAWRAPDFPLNAALATPEQQAWAMDHFVASAEHGWWPDQAGCTGGY
jgi:hypothetical protein